MARNILNNNRQNELISINKTIKEILPTKLDKKILFKVVFLFRVIEVVINIKVSK